MPGNYDVIIAMGNPDQQSIKPIYRFSDFPDTNFDDESESVIIFGITDPEDECEIHGVN
jgi:hypothetical protein